jgi:hypothetical protein
MQAPRNSTTRVWLSPLCGDGRERERAGASSEQGEMAPLGSVGHVRHQLDLVLELPEALGVHLLVVEDLYGHPQASAATLVYRTCGGVHNRRVSYGVG